jgi:hypothetical protein
VPTVLRVDGFRLIVLLPPREHGPAHVHVSRAGGAVTVELLTLAVRDVRGMTDAEVRAAVRIVAANEGILIAEWRKYHGA